MDLDRFLSLPGTEDGRRVVTLLADPTMTAPDGTPAGFLSLVDRGANLRRFQVVKASELEPATPPGDLPQAWLGRFLTALGLGNLVAKLATKADAPAPLTFDAAITAERLRRTRWEATDALWDVIGNVMASDLEDKAGAISLALGQFSATVMGLVSAVLATKAEDRAEVLAVLEAGPELEIGQVSKAGRVISARNQATIESARAALAQASAALEALIALASPPTDPASKANPADPLEDFMNAATLEILATKAADNAIKAAKAAGVTVPAELATVGATASTEVYKAAVMGPPQAAMPTNALAQQIAPTSVQGQVQDPAAMFAQVLGQVSTLATKVDELTKAVNGHGEGETREPGILELATKAAELADLTAGKVAKLEGTPAAPRAAGDPPPVVTRKAGQADPTDATWKGSALQFTGQASS